MVTRKKKKTWYNGHYAESPLVKVRVPSPIQLVSIQTLKQREKIQKKMEIVYILLQLSIKL